jgi:hypothetical protein
MAAGLAAALPLALRWRRVLDALVLGEDSAASLGLPLPRVRLVLVLLMALATGTGGVAGRGWWPLSAWSRRTWCAAMVPGARMPAAAAVGAGRRRCCWAADVAGALLIAPQELPVGVLTAVLGGVYLLVLLRRQGRHDPCDPESAPVAETADLLGCDGPGEVRGEPRGADGVVTLRFAPGWTAIVGPNGAGKSTLLRCWPGCCRRRTAGAAARPAAGRLAPGVRAPRIAWLAQQGEADGELTGARDVVALGRLPHQGCSARPGAGRRRRRWTQRWPRPSATPGRRPAR